MSSLWFHYLEGACLVEEKRDSYHWRSSTSEITLKIQFTFRHVESIMFIFSNTFQSFRNVNDHELLRVDLEKFRYFITTIIVSLKFVNGVLERSPIMILWKKKQRNKDLP